MPFENVMLDLETLGTKPGSVILSIGAVAFDPETGELGAEFHEIMDVTASLLLGLKIEADTLRWWLSQSETARETLVAALRGTAPMVYPALDAFSVYLARVAGSPENFKTLRVWGNGSDFDQPLLAAVYDAAGHREVPWKFFNNRCYRTLKNLYPEVKMRRTGTHHNALDDARSQAVHACALIQHMRGMVYARKAVDILDSDAAAQ